MTGRRLLVAADAPEGAREALIGALGQLRKQTKTSSIHEEVWSTAASGYTEAITCFDIVGGLHADLPFQYYVDLIAGLKERFPQVHLKAFTMVEIAFFAKIGKIYYAARGVRQI